MLPKLDALGLLIKINSIVNTLDKYQIVFILFYYIKIEYFIGKFNKLLLILTFVVVLYSPCTFKKTKPKITPNRIKAELMKAAKSISFPIFF